MLLKNKQYKRDERLHAACGSAVFIFNLITTLYGLGSEK
jgi:hypothetical protein